MAIALIKAITEERSERALTDAERTSLTHAVGLLDAASAPFAPHELARGSRQRRVSQVRNTWRL